MHIHPILFPIVSVLLIGGSRAVNMSGPVAEFVNTKISSDTVVIFSKSYCPYCRMAKEVFDKLKLKYTVIELDERDDGGEVQDVLGEMTGARSVPRVFLKGKFIGGGTEVKDLYGKGELQKMIAA
ncbi:uncharacterized protein LOC128989995 isoform X2 [Macrosteles quadrilineatus]|uniref:uncharacterized protein LOC128989685 isoform X2 n=1 Tax=Macrosteles quadrilineatus TaxID=74068 RepID=UPI0023E2712F|nr:uncharacterized protein LOC128989685 isoform X2 [Macrosteles quadrilineatus]XP_054268165.1 uncharacterized protein LOC128989995 isoform X2 [Macrosteles quadrilineatus]